MKCQVLGASLPHHACHEGTWQDLNLHVNLVSGQALTIELSTKKPQQAECEALSTSHHILTIIWKRAFLHFHLMYKLFYTVSLFHYPSLVSSQSKPVSSSSRSLLFLLVPLSNSSP